ncbi:MAG: hypothetical protein HYY03_05970 [Chloroflexi bacterium]|nr:hypothetical protein [Chloroflexota bacterium]
MPGQSPSTLRLRSGQAPLRTGELNVYIIGDSLSPRERERVQAQVQTALRSLPEWAFGLLGRRLQQLGAANLPLIIEPQVRGETSPQALGLGQIDGRPAARLLPRLRGDDIDWRQDQRYLVAKAVAYLAAPAPSSDADYWARWSAAIASDGLRDKARATGEHWAEASDLDLLIEMFAAYALNPHHDRWAGLPAVRAFLDEWRQTAVL